MSRVFYFFLIVLCTNLILSQSIATESLTLKSELLQKDIKYSIYLPDNYRSSTQDYPVLYLLHGFWGNETDWLRTGDLQKVMDAYILEKKIKPFIVVMPDGDDRLNMNKEDGTYPYEDMLIKEFIPQIENMYRIKEERNSRAIGGSSMGGAGALRLSFLYPELFGTCIAFSAGISTDEELMNEAAESFDEYFGKISPSVIGKKGKDRINKTIKDYDVLRLARKLDAQTLESINIYFDCGDDDVLTTIGNGELHKILIERKIAHEFRVRNGGHDWEFWKASLPLGLQFMNQRMP